MVYLVMLMLPNIIWTKNQPKDYEKYAQNENKVLLAFERIGEVLVSCIALIFSDFNLNTVIDVSVHMSKDLAHRG
jgi:hypothetical protein